MRRRRLILGFSLSTLVSAPIRAAEPTGPQPELPKEKLIIVTRDGTQHTFNVEMALTAEQQTAGEMFQ